MVSVVQLCYNVTSSIHISEFRALVVNQMSPFYIKSLIVTIN